MKLWLETLADLRLNCAPTFYHCPADWHWRTRRFPDSDFWMVMSGHGELTLDKQRFPVSRGSFFLWNPGDEPDGRHDPAHPLTVFFCHFDALDAQGQVLPPLELPRPLQLDDLAFFEGCARRAEKLWQRDDDAQAEAQHILRRLLWQVADEAHNGVAPRDELMEKLGARLHLDFAREWTLEKMAKATHLSRSQVARRFRARFDTTPAEFLLQIRVENARHLLLETPLSLEAIAFQTGFCDAAHFSRAFKAFAGFSPGALRKR